MNWEAQLARAAEEENEQSLVPRALEARNLCRQKQYGRALEILWAMLRTARRDEARHQEAFVLIHIGKVYRNWIWDVALKFFKDGLQVAQSSGFKRGEMIASNAIAELYYSWGKYDQAIEYHQRSLESADNLTDSKSRRDIILDMVECYGERGEFETCDQLLQEAAKLDKAMGITAQNADNSNLRVL